MATGDLISLASAKAWLQIADSNSDAILRTWITGASRAALNCINRGQSLGYRTVNEVRNGPGGLSLILKEWPVLSVSALSIDGTILSVQTDKPFGSGFYWEAWNGDDTQGHQTLWCAGARFPRGNQNVSVSYTAGYQVQSEPQQILASAGYQVVTNRAWYSDQGVISSDGIVFVAITTGTPSTGQYIVDPLTGIYTFAAADVDTDILITYSYIPEDLKQAVIDMVSWHWRNRDRIGMVSRSQGGQETTAFSQASVGKLTMDMLRNFASVIPI